MIPVHIVSGFLGAGKTTLLLDQLTQRASTENCAVIVNDFGEASYDALLLGAKAAIKDIPGGCLCCTAPENLSPSIMALLKEQKPSRIFIEATGLAHPADLVDTLQRQIEPGLIEIAPVIAVLDPAQVQGDEQPQEIQEQLDAADIWVLNHLETANSTDISQARSLAQAHYPPLLSCVDAKKGAIPSTVLDLRASDSRKNGHKHDHEGHSHSDSWIAASKQWPASHIFDMAQVRTLVQGANVERIKGIFHTDIGWYQVERAGGQLKRSPTPFRTISRVDVIGKKGSDSVQQTLSTLEQCTWQRPDPSDVPEIRLEMADKSLPLTRELLMGLKGQVSEVEKYVPGRAGQGVWLSSVLEHLDSPENSQFIVLASDGMSTEAISVAGVGKAILVHSLKDQALPMNKGGPFRILIPPGEGQSACSNVKKVARIIIEPLF